MALTIQERLKDLRVERGLTLEQLAEQTHLSKSALGSYEAEDFKDISHYALIKLAKFYSVTADYLLGLSETKNHPNADLADLRVSDDMIELLKSGLVDNSLLCKLAAHPDFPRLMADLEIYVNGTAVKQVQSANAIVDIMSATIMNNPLENFLQAAEAASTPGSDPEQAAMAFICKRLKLNYGKLSEEERKWLKRIAQKSDLLKNPKPQRGRK